MDEFSNGQAIHSETLTAHTPRPFLLLLGASVLVWLLVALAGFYVYDAARERWNRSTEEGAFWDACFIENTGAPVIFPNGNRVCYRTDHLHINIAGQKG